MSRIRNSRIGEQMKKELSQIIQLELKDPRVGFVTVTAVDVTGDLQLAKVFISVMGSEEQKNDTVGALEKAKGFIRSELGKRVQLRHIPELQFKMDESIEYGSKIENLLNDIKKESKDGV